MQWLYNKMCALPLPEVLGDFEDAIKVEHFNPSLNGRGAYKGDILKILIFNTPLPRPPSSLKIQNIDPHCFLFFQFLYIRLPKKC